MVIIGNFAIIHRGYLDIIQKYPDANVYILSEKFANKLYPLETDLRKLPIDNAKGFLSSLERQIHTLDEEDITHIKESSKIILIDDDVVEELRKKHFAYHPNIVIENGFFYRPKDDVYKEEKKVDLIKNYTDKDTEIMKKAIILASESGCYWRQVASIIVKDGKTIYQTFNQMLPNKDECYKIGCIRDGIEPGKQTETCSAVHSEANAIAQAAKDGQSLKDTSIYVTVFPCPACAKLIALSGIKKCYYSEGWANFDGERVMKSAGIEIIKIDL